ncbi:MAG: membrane protein insertase YidC [Oceanospirillales bacterium LUC14_002_19_P2]|nr:MAG: membrane protein insertase YidC [Oceanospirillales bacterium LUC14_002_19_P2]
MDLQRTILIVGLAVVGYLMVLQWNQDYNKPPELSTTEVVSVGEAPVAQAATGSSDAPVLESDTVVDHGSAASAQLITVTTDTLNVTIDTRGGDIVSVALPEYPKVKSQPDNPFVLLENSQNRLFVAQSGLTGTDGPDRHGHPVFTAAKTSYQLEDGKDNLQVDLTLKTDKADITKRYTFERGGYQVSVDYLIHNTSDQTWRGNFYGQLKRDNSKDPSSEFSSKTTINTYLGAAVRSNEKQYQKVDFDDFASKPFKETVEGGYAAILQHYFVVAWVPGQEQQNTYQTRVVNGNNIISVVETAVEVKPGQAGVAGAILYVGPKNQEVLAKLADGLNLTIDYGILWWFAKPLFELLKFLHSILGNWGWSIIALTVIVKAVFFPLSAASYRSMAKMRKLSPKLQALKEQYGDDRQKMSQAMMEMYKKEKVNPMGGCLPILVQMPVFIALYWVLLESVEIRQAPFILWIHDLSQMDPYFILPLIMGASMFVQQLLSPTPPDPVQARVMKLMPVIFTVFFLWFPAGLVLYWVVNNLLSIAQQYYITRKIEADPNA